MSIILDKNRGRKRPLSRSIKKKGQLSICQTRVVRLRLRPRLAAARSFPGLLAAWARRNRIVAWSCARAIRAASFGAICASVFPRSSAMRLRKACRCSMRSCMGSPIPALCLPALKRAAQAPSAWFVGRTFRRDWQAICPLRTRSRPLASTRAAKARVTRAAS